MRNYHLARLILAGLLLGGLAEITLDVFAQRRGRSMSRGSISRYGGSRYNSSSYRSRNYQRGSVKNYQNRFPADAWKGYNRSSTQTRQGSFQGLSTQNLSTRNSSSRSQGASTQNPQQRSQALGQAGGQSQQPGQSTQPAGRQRGPAGQSEGGVPDGSWSRETARGGTIEISKSTQGDTTKINTNLTTAEGRTASGTKTATRDGDTIKVEGQQLTGSGASRQTSSEIKLDDGQVEKVKRETETSGRYGETIERESEFKRDGDVIKYEGKTETSTGRKMETEAEIFRTASGGIGAVGEIDTKHWGNYDFVHGRGPRGQETAIYGPYGGTLVTALPNGTRRVTVVV